MTSKMVMRSFSEKQGKSLRKKLYSQKDYGARGNWAWGTLEKLNQLTYVQ